MSLREEIARVFQTGRARTLVHLPDDIRRIAAQRGIRIEEYQLMGCRSCSASGQVASALMLGFGHFPAESEAADSHECHALDRDLYFLRPLAGPNRQPRSAPRRSQ